MKIKLYCICGAGASAVGFYKWKQEIDPHFELCPLELPGRGLRDEEETITELDELVEDLFSKYFEVQSNEQEYMIFGTCFGAIVAYWLYNKIKERNIKLPSHIFLATSSPPNGTQYWIPLLDDIKYKNDAINLFSAFFPASYFSSEASLEQFVSLFTDSIYQHRERENKKELYTYIDREDLTNEEKDNLIEFGIKMAELFKIDSFMLRNHQKKNRKLPSIQVDMTVMAGDMDEIVSLEEAREWEHLCDGTFDFKIIHGTHMFFTENYKEVLEIIKAVL